MYARLILGLDVGTTNCKAVLLDASARIVRAASIEYAFSVPRAGWSEQDPAQWWSAVRRVVRTVLDGVDRAAVTAVGLSGQMHGLVALDADGGVLRPCVLWNDQRSARHCRAMTDLLGGPAGLARYTNNAMLPGYTGGKILWVRENEPAIYSRIATVVLPKDYIRFLLTGELSTDVSDASGTGLFDVRARGWSKDLLAAVDLPEAWFPEARESRETAGVLQATAARELGLPEGVPVAAGGGDACMQVVGSGITDSRTLLVTIGTGGNVTLHLPRCVENPGGRLQVFCHCIDGQWVAMGVTLAAGGSLRWFRDALADPEKARATAEGRDAYELLNEMAAASAPGANGLVFLPYLAGERCPHADPDARGVWLGLGLDTSRADMARSVYEGVTYSLRDAMDVIESRGIVPDRICASGGGARSTLWLRLLANVFERPVHLAANGADASVVGAAIVAGIGAGMWGSFEEATSGWTLEPAAAPDATEAKAYRKRLAVYQTLYPALRSTFEALSIQEEGGA